MNFKKKLFIIPLILVFLGSCVLLAKTTLPRGFTLEGHSVAVVAINQENAQVYMVLELEKGLKSNDLINLIDFENIQKIFPEYPTNLIQDSSWEITAGYSKLDKNVAYLEGDELDKFIAIGEALDVGYLIVSDIDLANVHVGTAPRPKEVIAKIQSNIINVREKFVEALIIESEKKKIKKTFLGLTQEAHDQDLEYQKEAATAAIDKVVKNILKKL